MIVQELFEAEKIGSDFITENFDGGYWDTVAEFVLSNWRREIEDMTPKQAAWLTKILDDCVEKRIEG